MSSVVALLGRGEVPANGVADYCNNLAEAFAQAGERLDIVTVHWFDRGWLGGLAALRRENPPARGDWAILQYTAMGWSWRGFPFGALATIVALRMRGVRCGVVMHEPWRQGENHARMIDRIRAASQDFVVRWLHRLTELSIFTLPLAHIPWLGSNDPKSVFIPLGPNVPENLTATFPPNAGGAGAAKTVCVFCLSERPGRDRELSDIASASRAAAAAGAKLRVVFVGRGTENAAAEIAAAFEGSGIETECLGLQDPSVISRTIAASDALLCVRSALNLRRGSALAGLACGIPIVAYSGGEKGTPLMEAGVALAPLYDRACARRSAYAGAVRRCTRPGDAPQEYRCGAKIFFLGRGDQTISSGASSGAALRMKLLIYSNFFMPHPGGTQTIVLELAQRFSEWHESHPDAERIEVTVATQTRDSWSEDARLPYRVVRGPGNGELRRLIRAADLVHLAGAALSPLVFCVLMRKRFVVEHHAFQVICPNGQYFYEPSAIRVPWTFYGGPLQRMFSLQSRGDGRKKQRGANSAIQLSPLALQSRQRKYFAHRMAWHASEAQPNDHRASRHPGYARSRRSRSRL